MIIGGSGGGGSGSGGDGDGDGDGVKMLDMEIVICIGHDENYGSLVMYLPPPLPLVCRTGE